MTDTVRKTTFVRRAADGATIIHRAFQPLRKDGSDAKRPARITSQQLHVYPDGSFRYYGREGVLRRERVSRAVLAEDYARACERDELLGL